MMIKEKYDFKTFDTIFNPKHIAFIGASENSALGSMLYLPAFKESRWSDTFYPVNPNRDKILDWKCYPSVLDIPYPVDTAYISLKVNIIPKVVKECVEKKIRWLIIFASGFSESGDPDGVKFERELQHMIRSSNTRIIGPNCLGPFNSSNGMAFTFNAEVGPPGFVSFMSQSGGHLTQLFDIGFKRDIRFRYGVSFGNQIDLNCVDFLRHFAQDSKTKIICCYLESFGSGSGRNFFLELRETCKVKPIVIWKGGYTKDGARAAFSHTGAIASDDRLWNSMVKQTGAILVKDNEEFWNAIKTFELLFPKYLPKGRNVGIITPGGGSSVFACDIFGAHNLKVPTLSNSSQEKIAEILPRENINFKNPIDLGASGFVLDIFLNCIEVVVNDPNIDIVVVPLWGHHIYHYVFKKMIKLQKRTTKPFLFCLPSIADSIELASRFERSKKVLHEHRVLYYLSLRDAAKCLSSLCNYSDFLRNRGIDPSK